MRGLQITMLRHGIPSLLRTLSTKGHSLPRPTRWDNGVTAATGPKGARGQRALHFLMPARGMIEAQMPRAGQGCDKA